MGINVSKTLSTSPSFTTACDAVYDQCLDLAQHAFPGIRPYQLPHAAVLLHASFISSSSVPLISRWVPSPPDQAQVDWALRKTKMESEESLTREEFREFAVELFRFEILKGVEGMLVSRVPIGIAAIAGIGVVGKLGSGVVGSVAGVYALGVAASVYLGLT